MTNVWVRPVDDERVARRRRYDASSVGPSHAPPTGVGGEFKDILPCLEVIL
jgi:hypothetical protein